MRGSNFWQEDPPCGNCGAGPWHRSLHIHPGALENDGSTSVFVNIRETICGKCRFVLKREQFKGVKILWR